MLRRNLYMGSVQLKQNAYFALVRSILEYGCCVWDPFTQDNIRRLENIQRRSARFVRKDYSKSTSVTSLLEDLGWASLQERRAQAKICLLHKITHNIVATEKHQYLTNRFTRSSRRFHTLAYSQHMSSSNAYKYSFFPSTILVWNSLENNLVTITDPDQFKGQLAGLKLTTT